MANPFKKIADNASATAFKDNGTVLKSSVNTVSCPQCGSPRPVNTNIARCAYCGYELMTPDVNIKLKPNE